MPTYKLRALVLRKTKLGETDTILTLLAQDGREVRAVAKGLRKPGGRFGARLEPYSDVELMLHTGRTLDVITEASTLDAHSGLREDFDRAAAASVVADLLDKIAVEGQVEERLFALAATSFSVMETAPVEQLTVLVVAFLVKAMSMHGYRPTLDVCACCGGEPGESKAFSMSAGGVLCETCAGTDSSALRVAPEARAWLGRLLGSTMAELAETDVPAQAVADCFVLIRSFVAFHLPARLRALDFYAGQMQ